MDIKKIAQDLFDKEICELEKVKSKISDSLEVVVNLILESKGKVVITGIGKSGIIGKKIAATLASTGTHAVFMNAAEGLHGDLGIISKNDIVIAISNSGNSDEVLSIIPSIKKIGAILVAMTGNPNSSLGKLSNAILNIGVEQEGCPLNLAPMSSTTSTLVMGDALATVLIKARNFKPENFAVYHPGGSLGRRLLMKVKDVMHKDLPIVETNSDMDNVIMTMTKKRLGVVCIVENDILLGIITEGDIRRALKMKDKFFSLKAEDIMTTNYTYATEDIMALDALELMENRESQISVLPVLDSKKVVGVVRIHDLLNVVGK
ncbi:KpsF/GutQ family sugar-phosphate isomerase [Cetobacterium sp. 8H]|uniref:KpsF/GutQ family sugar-phosphate isomerase n=1 Tax=Cetobacterium sp. 8H TaxID=2759681 RepID=UPI00163B6C73|nr:KpsF/GutQ family sugar-phosphate isomerase [Cetobacterium sp. 8H]MBC2851304.1 KpsF/GutQ family sugar-phosphate isomerase [Cetobacterium sp. 8H]